MLRYFYIVCFTLSTIAVAQASNYNDNTMEEQNRRVTLNDSECEELIEMYSTMLHRYKNPLDTGFPIFDPVNPLSKQIELFGDSPLNMVKALTIELPMPRIRDVFERHGVLQLRPFKGKSLLIGCGNNPIEKLYKPADPEVLKNIIKEEELDSLFDKGFYVQSICDHRHKDYDTINPALTMNPTIVAAFGFNKLEQLLPKTYERVSFEGIDPILDDSQYPEKFERQFGNAKVSDLISNPEDIRENLETTYENIRVMIEEYKKEYERLDETNNMSSFEDYFDDLDDGWDLILDPSGSEG